jgi:predicted RNase H-like nuclease (RuvC/YqgF family)
VEQDRNRLRDTLVKYEEENRHQAASLEESRIEVLEVRKQIEIYEEKIATHNAQRDEKINAQNAHIKELEAEVEGRGKRIRDL